MRFSIITPAYNMAQYISETIESVLSQEGNFDIEYIIMDGESTDETLDIIKRYEQALNSGDFNIKCNNVRFKWVSEKDNGMYDAINKGFSNATGDVYAWLNADDMYEKGAFQAIAQALRTFPDINWIKGITKNIEEDGTIIRNGCTRIHEQKWLKKGVYGRQAYFVEQDSVFWRASLWKEVGNIPNKYSLAGDYWLWIQFAHLFPLQSLNIPISIFRKRKEQLSQNITPYKKEQREIIQKTGYEFSLLRFFFSFQSRLAPRFGKFFIWLYPILFMRKEKTYFININNGKMIKEEAVSYITHQAL